MDQPIQENLPDDNDSDIPAAKSEGPAWYYNPWMIVVAILCFGPLALPLVWMRPNTPTYIKISATVIVVAATVWMTKGAMVFYGQLMETYNSMTSNMQGAQ